MKMENRIRENSGSTLIFLCTLLLMLLSFNTEAQRTLISDDATYSIPHSSSVLDIYSGSKGLLVPRLSAPPAGPIGGLMYYNTSHNSYWYYNGSGWVEFVWEKFWARTSPTQIHGNDLIANYGIGTPGPFFQFHIFDPAATGIGSIVPQLVIENSNIIPAGNGHISIGFQDNSGIIPLPYTIGVDRMNGPDVGTFKIQSTSQVQPSSHGDKNTILRAFPSGIVDLNNQSRSRAYQFPNTPLIPSNTEVGQPIAPGIWTPVYFDQRSYDEQSELALLSSPPVPWVGGPPPPSYFKATEEGYYQVNARVDFIWVEYGFENDLPAINPIFGLPITGGYVSIAIVKTDPTGGIAMYAHGNKLQGHNQGIHEEEFPQNGLAPNVSDVIYCKKGENIYIYVWQSIHSMPIPLRLLVLPPDDNGLPGAIPASSQVYVSIHKVS